MNGAIQTAFIDLVQREGDIRRRIAELENRQCDNTGILEATLCGLVTLNAELVAVKTRKALLQTFDELLSATPARSGRAQAGWTLSTTGDHQESALFAHTGSYDAARVDAAVAETLNRLPENVFETLSLGNAVPYLALLEAGLSEQAPAGFVARATENLRARLTSLTRI